MGYCLNVPAMAFSITDLHSEENGQPALIDWKSNNQSLQPGYAEEHVGCHSSQLRTGN